jgi:hypothetical protein
VDGRGVSRHQRVEFAKRISDRAAVEAGYKLPVVEIDLINVSDVAVVDLLVVVVLNLHHLVAWRENPPEALYFLLAGWVQCGLQLYIEGASTHPASIHWAENLGSDREPVALFTGEAVHAYLGQLPDETIEAMLNELSIELGAALGQERIYVAFADRTWILDAGERTDEAKNPA